MSNFQEIIEDMRSLVENDLDFGRNIAAIGSRHQEADELIIEVLGITPLFYQNFLKFQEPNAAERMRDILLDRLPTFATKCEKLITETNHRDMVDSAKYMFENFPDEYALRAEYPLEMCGHGD